ncbi:dipicolinate synthase subunit B [Lachnospiraceae bacterium XBB1006]|nr:dipicolinate synthase subunit B [Lachnospiraceae bacterium XBB1006]
MTTSPKIGFGITGSFCTFSKILPVIQTLKEAGYDLYPIFSPAANTFDTRFAKADSFRNQVETITGHQAITTIVDAEPIGPKHLLNGMMIAPCTGNTLAKLACGITDTPVLMSAKAQLRNGGPVLLFVSTNDGLGLNFKNIGLLMNTENIYFVPFCQDDPEKKPNSLVANPTLVPDALAASLIKKQLQPVFSPPYN